MDEPGIPPPDAAPPPLGIPLPELLPDEPPELLLAPPEDPLELALPPLDELLAELLEELLEELLPDDPLDPELLGEGIDAEGIDGVDGVVGVLAEGHPAISGSVMSTAANHPVFCLVMSKPPRFLRSVTSNAQS